MLLMQVVKPYAQCSTMRWWMPSPKPPPHRLTLQWPCLRCQSCRLCGARWRVASVPPTCSALWRLLVVAVQAAWRLSWLRPNWVSPQTATWSTRWSTLWMLAVKSSSQQALLGTPKPPQAVSSILVSCPTLRSTQAPSWWCRAATTTPSQAWHKPPPTRALA